MVALTVIEGGGSDALVDELQWPESPDEPLHVRLNRMRSNAEVLRRRVVGVDPSRPQLTVIHGGPDAACASPLDGDP
jgi:hypothetical protein